MYSGKTTLGRQLAKLTGWDFVDLDALFEQRYHTAIPLFFSRYGESAFRKLERLVLESTENMDRTIISTGGGTPCQGDNMDWILAHGMAVYLEMDVDAVCRRIQRSKKNRPLLMGMTPEQQREFVERQLSQRIPFYLRAQHKASGENPDLAAIVEWMNCD
ncbi:MAG: shikimate kinase [Bacteroidales bacterium]|nr:shikimate kinase [Bacteroidales bacterium]